MKLRNTLLAALAALTLTAAALTGCGGSGGSSAETETTQAAQAQATPEEASGMTFRTLDEIKNSGTVRIGVFDDKKPFGYVDGDGAYQGYDVIFAKRLAEDLGVKAEFVPTAAADRVEALQSGSADIILANFTATDERRQQVDFCLPYMNVSLGVVSPEDHVIREMSDVRDNESVIVISGTTAEAYLTEHFPAVRLRVYDSYDEAIAAFKNGDGAAFANDNTEVLAFAAQNSGYTVGIPTMGDTDTIAPAVAQGNETLRTWINTEIQSLGKEQFFHNAYEQTLAETYGADFADRLVVEGGKIAE